MSKLRKQGTVKWLCVCHSGWYLHSGVCVCVCVWTLPSPFVLLPPAAAESCVMLLCYRVMPAHVVW